MNTSYLVETKDLTRIYGDGEEIRALDRVNLKVAQGELVTVMGPSGSGKSTLLNMIGALDVPTNGQVLISSSSVASTSCSSSIIPTGQRRTASGRSIFGVTN